MKKINDWEKSLLSKYSYDGYSNHFQLVYRLAHFGSWVLLFISAMLSGKFFESFFASAGEFAFYIGWGVSFAIAIAIGIFTDKVMVYYNAQKHIEPLLGSILIALILFNVYADYQGGPEWSHRIIGEAPTDTRTSEIAGIYTPQIKAIESQIDAIEQREFYWCGTHMNAHKCDQAQYYVDPKADKKHVAKISELANQKARLVDTMNGLLQSNGEQYGAKVNEHTAKIETTKSRMRMGSLVCTGLFLVLSFWMHSYGNRFVSEATDTQQNDNGHGFIDNPTSPAPRFSVPITSNQSQNVGFQFGGNTQPIQHDLRPKQVARNGYKITCKECGHDAIMKSSKAQFCSDECRYIAHGLKKPNV